MAKPILPDSVWWLVEPLVSGSSDRHSSGRRPITDRRTLTGILYVLLLGVPWDQLPYEMGCGAGMTCLRRLRRWQRSGAWDGIQRLLRENLPNASSMDWSRVNVQRKRAAVDQLPPPYQPEPQYQHVNG